MPGEAAERRAAEDAYVRAVGVSAVLGLLVTLVSIRWIPGPLGATLGVGQGVLGCAVLLARHRHPWHRNLILFGLASGLAELPADAWLVGTGTLVYPAGARLWASPVYMPPAWLGMLSGGLALGLLLRRRLGGLPATLLCALGMGLWIPLFEGFARLGRWWWYVDSPLLFGAVPAFIAVGEIGIALPLVAVAERLRTASVAVAIAVGLGHGAWIFVCYWLARRVCGG